MFGEAMIWMDAVRPNAHGRNRLSYARAPRVRSAAGKPPLTAVLQVAPRWHVVTALSLSLLVVWPAAAQTRLSEAPPGAEPDIPITNPVWNDCEKQPSPWSRITTCRTCSPGFWTGDELCLTHNSSLCGSPIGITGAGKFTVTHSVACGGASVAVSAEFTASGRIDCPPPSVEDAHCKNWELQICYPNGRLRMWKCERDVPVKRELIPVGGGEYCWRVTQWRTETFYTSEFDQGGNGSAFCRPEEAGCFCKARGHDDCECEQPNLEHNGDAGIDDYTELPITAFIDSALARSLTFELSHLSDATRGGVYLDSLSHLSLRQLAQLKAIVTHAEGLVEVPEETSVYLVFENGDRLVGSFPLMLAEIQAQYNALAASVWKSDVNFDGDVDLSDAVAILVALADAVPATEDPSYFDLGVDGFVGWEDYAILMADVVIAAGSGGP